MKEKEKMLKGELYNPISDPELYYDRIKCKTLCQKYNSLLPNQVKEKTDLIKKIFSKTGKNIWIEPNFWCDYGYNTEVGENFYMNHGCVILDPAKVTFGDNVFIGPSCGFYTAGHPIDSNTRNQGLEYAKPIKVGNNVWIGGNVSVMPGIEIGNNVVIGAGSVVTKNIPDNSIAAGSPAKIIRKSIDG